MPFAQRTVKPVYLSRHRKKDKTLFEDLDDVTNFTLSQALKQLASLSFHADDVFRSLHNEMCDVNRRCKNLRGRIARIHDQVEELDSEKVLIPVSELDIERGLPPHLRYQSPNSVEEDLFTIDTRSPCVIHLHQRTRQDLNHILRGSSAYAKVQRPKSFDARLLLDASYPYEDGVFSPQSPRNSSFVSSSTQINTKVRPDLETSQNSSERSMRIDSSTGQGDIVKVDTSGANFDRQASLRRSHRLSSSGVRQRANAAQRRQQRHKHKTLTALPGNISSELGDSPLRPYSVYSHSTTSEGKSFNGQVSTAVSPKQVHLRNVEIQTDDVRVIPLTPAQKRMRQKVFSSNNSSPTNSQSPSKYIESPTAVSCQTPAMMKQTSTPINDVFDNELIRPSCLDVKNNDTSTDEGRHTGESSPPTPVRTGTPQELMASPQLKKSQNSSVETVNLNAGNQAVKPDNVALRIDGGRLNQAEDVASSGCWSGAESAQHSSSSDITMQHAPIVSALQQVLRNGRVSPKYGYPHIKVSPIVDNKPLVSSAVSSSTVSINSKLSKLDMNTSQSSLNRDSDDRFDSPASSVISVTINRSHHASNGSLTSVDGGRAISAAAMVKKTRKSRLNGIGGEYNFMNYECDPLENETVETKVIKSRRSTRSMKRNKKHLGADDTISLSSMADLSPRHTEAETMSVHSVGRVAADATSLSGSTYSGEQDERSSPLRSEKSNKGSKPHTPVGDTPDAVFPSQDTEQIQSRDATYDSYHRAIKSNHATPKSLVSRPKAASVKVLKSQPAIDFQSELNRRLSVRPVADKNLKKGKRGAPPPPPKRASSLSNSSCPSPSLSLRSECLPSRNFNTPSPKHALSVEEYYRSTPPPKTPTVTPATTPSPSKKSNSPIMVAPNSLSIPPATAPLSRKAIVPIVANSKKASPGVKNVAQIDNFYRNTPPPPPPADQLPPPPPELLTPIDEVLPPVPVVAPAENSKPKTPTSPKTPSELTSPMQSIAMQAAMLGNRMSQKKKRNGSTDQEDAVNDVVTYQNINQSKDPAEHSKINQSQKVESDSSVQTTSPKRIVTTTNETSSNSLSSEIMRQKSKLKSRPSGFKLPTTPTEENSSYKSHEIKSPAVPTSPSEKQVKSPPPSNKSPPPVAIKGFSMPKKTPPPTSSKPTFSSKPAVSTKPPLVKSKPVVKEDFGSQRAREKSPSYRASLARAAFFANISSTQSETRKPTATTDSDKPFKVPLVTASPTETTTQPELDDQGAQFQTNQSTKVQLIATSPNDSKNEGSIPENLENSQNQIKAPETATDAAKIPTTVVNHESNELEEYSNALMDELEDLSPPIKETTGSPISTSKSTTSPRYSNYDNLMAAIHKSKREALSSKSPASPPTSPAVNGEAFSFRTNGNGSPASTIERKRNGRLSSNGHRNAMSRRSTGATSRNDFKTLLLQNACRGSSSSNMSAAEKLSRNKPANSALSRLKPSSSTDAERSPTPSNSDNGTAEGNGPPELSLSEIRSAITSGSATTSRVGRSNRRGARPNGTDSKYNTRSRTPTRPMMSIFEDNETEKSPEAKPIRSIVDADT